MLEMIDRVTETVKNGKSVSICVLYRSGTMKTYKQPYNTIPKTINQFINKAYVYFVRPGEKLYKLNHD